MATHLLAPSPSPLRSPLRTKIKPPPPPPPSTTTSISLSLPIQFHRSKLCCLSHYYLLSRKATGVSKLLALVNEETVFTTEEINNVNEENDFGLKKQTRPCELYVCNLPRSCEISDLVEMFRPFGTVLSAEVTRNPDTGVSKGCGYITMGSIEAARNAVSALDGSDCGGREMRVSYSVEIGSARRKPESLNTAPIKNLIYESPHKLYIGNLPWGTKPEELRNLFSRFGTIVSARVLRDRKGGRDRSYGFLSFSSAAEREAAISLNGTDFYGRVLVVKKGVEKQPSLE